jgi:hypothetical protein
MISIIRIEKCKCLTVDYNYIMMWETRVKYYLKIKELGKDNIQIRQLLNFTN